MTQITKVPVVHISDVRTWRKCRRKHYFSSSMHMKLEPDYPYVPFFDGRGVHEALHHKYETGADTLDTLHQWRDHEFARMESSESGLSLEDKQRLSEHVNLLEGMLAHYDLWQEHQTVEQDRNCDANLEFMALELAVEDIPLITHDGPARWQPAMWTWPDQSRNNWWPLFHRGYWYHPKEVDVYFGFRLDGVVRRKTDGAYWIFETKTTRSIAELKKSLDNDNQAGMYMWAAQQLLGVPISGVLYNIIRKKIPAVAKLVTKSGMTELSQDKSLDTTFDFYKYQLDALAVQFATDGQMIGDISVNPDDLAKLAPIKKQLYDSHRPMLERLWAEPNTFFERFEVRRTQTELLNLVADIGASAKEMLDPTTYVNPSEDWSNCSYCSFKRPCLLMNKGVAADVATQSGFRQREGWSEPTYIADEAR